MKWHPGHHGHHGRHGVVKKLKFFRTSLKVCGVIVFSETLIVGRFGDKKKVSCPSLWSGKYWKTQKSDLYLHRILPSNHLILTIPSELFYYPIGKDGLLHGRIKRLQKKNRELTGTGKYKKRKNTHDQITHEESTQIQTTAAAVVDEDAQRREDENIVFLKNASVTHQKGEIIRRFKENQNHRKRHYQTILVDYREVLKLMPELLLFDFESQYGPKNVRVKLTSLLQKIDEEYPLLSDARQKRNNEIIDEWTTSIQGFLKVLSFFPPVNTDANKQKATIKDSLSSFIIFFPLGTPPSEIMDDINKRGEGIQFFADGSNKKALSNFYLKVDDLILKIKATDFIDAFDFIFKVNFALNIDFKKCHSNFYKFIQHYIYGISLQKIPVSLKSVAARCNLN
uniref:Uncharacterized protein n=1 Tax=Phlebotomus papatasi TaxID=29031 RepID=A0A1B0D0V2_PHLPP